MGSSRTELPLGRALIRLAPKNDVGARRSPLDLEQETIGVGFDPEQRHPRRRPRAVRRDEFGQKLCIVRRDGVEQDRERKESVGLNQEG